MALKEKKKTIVKTFEGHIHKSYLNAFPSWWVLEKNMRIAYLQFPDTYQGASTFDGLKLSDHHRVKITFEIEKEPFNDQTQT